jgi:hypothetical protein
MEKDMEGIMKHAAWIAVLALAGPWADAAFAADDVVARLEALVKDQQQLIEAQGRRLADQEEKMERLTYRVNTMRQVRQRTILFSEEDGGSENSVTSGSANVRLAVSGQVHRALNALDDGDSTELYHVDSDASNSRIRFVGTGRVDEDLSIGTNIELAISPNNSGQVNQNDQSAGDFIDQRIADLFIDHATYGRLSLGKGVAVSDGTAEVDLSGTDVVAYSGWTGVMAGMLFFDDDADALGDVTVGSAMGNIDGLGRQNRISYETPELFGFELGIGANQDERYDGAVRWAGQGYGLQLASAAGIAHYGNGNAIDYRLSGSVSLLHEETGLNLTLAGGMDDLDRDATPGNRTPDSSSNLYAKLGWLSSLFDLGKTAFAVDVSRGENRPTRDDDGYSVGGVVVQNFDRFGAQFYSQFRWIEFDRKGLFDFQDVNVGTAGVRVKF